MSFKRNIYLHVFSCALFILVALPVHTQVHAQDISLQTEAPTSETVLKLTIPSEFLKTPKDRQAWERLEEVLKILSRVYHREIPGEEAVGLVFNGIADVDPHTKIITPDQFLEKQTNIRGSFGGVGMTIQKNPDGPGIRVVSPLPDTPADKAGVLPGDIIIGVGKELTTGMTLQQVVDLLRGEPGTNITFIISREGTDGPISITVTRAIVKIKMVRAELKDGGYGYIRIAQFGVPVPKQIKESLELLVSENDGSPLAGLTLDLRRNPGGLLDVADALLDMFLDSQLYIEDGRANKDAAKTISLERRGEISEEFYFAGTPGDILDGAPLLILVDRGSASASEILAGVLQIHGRAIVAGIETTFGKGTVQTTMPLKTGGAFTLTTAQYLIGPYGCEKPVQGVGVTPDIYLTSDQEASILDIREESLKKTLATSTIWRGNCQYPRTIPEHYWEAAYKMLDLLELEIDPKRNEGLSKFSK